jgi:hypothetical protein
MLGGNVEVWVCEIIKQRRRIDTAKMSIAIESNDPLATAVKSHGLIDPVKKTGPSSEIMEAYQRFGKNSGGW